MRLIHHGFILQEIKFQSTHPRGVRQFRERAITGCTSFQSTHPRGVRLVNLSESEIWRKFQSTHPRGVRLLAGRPHCATGIYFNPRTRVGCDPAAHNKGLHRNHFNPRTRVGCDFEQRLRVVCRPLFQSTHPRGVRPAWVRARITQSYFNPRTRVGCDTSCLFPHLDHSISIHAPAWGATAAGPAKRDGSRIFQSTHPRGVRQGQLAEIISIKSISIHAPAWGATTARQDFNPRSRISIHAPAWGATTSVPFTFANFKFQSTHPRGVRHIQHIGFTEALGISIHAPAWGATN